MAEASSRGHWLLLHHVHTCPKLVSQLLLLLGKLPPAQTWKLWLSASGDSDSISKTLLKSTSKIVLDSSLIVQSNVLHSLSNIPGELISASSRQEWLPLLHSMVMFHATVRLRKLSYKYSWSQDYQWTHSHLVVSSHIETDSTEYYMPYFLNSYPHIE